MRLLLNFIVISSLFQPTTSWMYYGGDPSETIVQSESPGTPGDSKNKPRPPQPLECNRNRGMQSQCNRDCGVQSRNYRPSIVRNHRMTHGRGANPHSWPWHVLVGLVDGGFCSGSLLPIKVDGVTLKITDVVITAAHCFYINGTRVRPEKIYIQAGRHSLIQYEGVEERWAIGLFPHEDFVLETLRDDLGIIVLDSPIKFTGTIRPICLPDKEIEITGHICILTGWGQMYNESTGEISIPEELQQSFAPIQKQSKCLNSYFGRIAKYNTETNLCAGDGVAYPGRGDSGGPLQCLVDGKWILYGVMSANSLPTEFPLTDDWHPDPGLFTRVTHYSSLDSVDTNSQWIQMKIVTESVVYRTYEYNQQNGQGGGGGTNEQHGQSGQAGGDTNEPHGRESRRTYPPKITYPIQVDDSSVQLRRSRRDEYYVEWISPTSVSYYVLIQDKINNLALDQNGHDHVSVSYQYPATTAGKQTINFNESGLYLIQVIRNDDRTQFSLDADAQVSVFVNIDDKHISDYPDPKITFPTKLPLGESVPFSKERSGLFYVEWSATFIQPTQQLFNVVVHSDPASLRIHEKPYLHQYSRVRKRKSPTNAYSYRQAITFPEKGKYVIKVARCDPNGGALSRASAIRVTVSNP